MLRHARVKFARMTRNWPFQNLYFEAGTSARKAANGAKSDWDCPTAKGRLESQISFEKKMEENQQYDSINQSEATIFIKKDKSKSALPRFIQWSKLMSQN